MELRRILKEYFSFSRGERLGMIVLIVLILIVIAVKRFVFYFEKPTPADRRQFERMLAERQALDPFFDSPKEELFVFDPNTIDSLTLMKLSLPRFVKNNLLSYRKRGGWFTESKDFRKLYGMNDSIYASIESYLNINRRETAGVRFEKRRVEETTLVSRKKASEKGALATKPRLINLNTSSAEELDKLKGIGPVLSKRIVRYRNLLGGFASIDQLEEVYGLKSEVVNENRAFLFADSLRVQKLDLNFLSVDELAAHPYINFKEARRIVDFRSKNGYISDKNILLSDSIIGEEHFRKLIYYLK